MKKMLVIIMILMLSVGSVFANGLPTYEDGDSSGFVSIDENTNNTLYEETVKYEITNIPGKDYNWIWGLNSYVNSYISSSITVTYKMKCGDVDEDTVMYFVLPTVDTGYITVDGVDFGDYLFAESLPASIDWKPTEDPSDPNSYEFKYSSAAIPLSFIAEEEKVLVINYVPSAGYNRSSLNINNVFDYVYYLTPAKYWDGDTKVNLELYMPEELSFESNIELKEVESGKYTATLNEIPNKEWVLYLSHMHDRYFKTNSSVLQNLLFLILYLLLCQTYRLIKPKRFRLIYQIITYSICFVIWFNVNVDIYGYPFGFLTVWFVYFVLGVIIPVLFFRSKIRQRKQAM